MIPQFKLYGKIIGLVGIVGILSYGVYLYKRVESLKKENTVMQFVISQKESEVKKTLDELVNVRKQLIEISQKSEQLSQLAEKRRLDVNWLNVRLKKLGKRISEAETPQQFETEISQEFTLVLDCIEAASGALTPCQIKEGE